MLKRAGSTCRLSTNGDACAALRAAPSACDLVIAAGRSGKPIAVEAAMDVPALAIAQAAVAAGESGVDIAVEIGRKLAALLAGKSATLFGGVAELAALRGQPVRIRIAQERDQSANNAVTCPDLTGGRNLALDRGVLVEPFLWGRIQSLAARTLVVGTTQSRERGAGAGLIDAD